MSSFSDNFPDNEIIDAVGDDVIYKRALISYTIKAVVEHNVQRVGNDGTIQEPRTEVEFMRSHIPISPQRGDVIKVGAVSYTVDGIASEDAASVRLYVKR